MNIQDYYVPEHMTTLSNYYRLQAENEQEATRDMALRMQFKDEERTQLNEDMQRELEMEREWYEC